MMTPTRLKRAVLLMTLVLLTSATARAELRTWTAASGGYTTEAEFVELKDGKLVRLRLKDGGEKELPLDKLSAADQDYVRGRVQRPAAPAGKPGAKSARLVKLEKDVDRSRSAKEALALCQVFRGDPGITEAERQAIEPRIAELQPLAEKNLVRMGRRWVTEEEANNARKQANEKMKLGFELLRLKQEDGFRKRFTEAAALEPDSVRAEFVMGLIYGIHNRNLARSTQYFESCLRRDPENVAVLNNLAVNEIKNAEAHGALQHWRKAMELAPDQRIVQNLGRVIGEAGDKHISIAKTMLDNFTSLYTSQLGRDKFAPMNSGRGWLYMLIDEDMLDLDLDEKKKSERPAVLPPREDGLEVAGGGTGFVVYPHYILTNAHVVELGAAFEIQTSDGSKDQTLKAEVVATSKSPDLALLRCDELTAPAVTLAPEPCSRGTDIMVLGYPEMFILGASLKATRGVISGLPSPALDNLYLYDATTNGGNSGGPVCDNHGSVIAVHCVGLNTASRYGGGIPAAAALEFVKKSVPDFQPTAPGTDKLEWTAVDQKISPSTVLVWVRQKPEASKAASLAGAGFLEDISCTACAGKNRASCQVCQGSGLDSKLVGIRVAAIIAAARAERPVAVSPPKTTPPKTTPPKSMAPKSMSPRNTITTRPPRTMPARPTRPSDPPATASSTKSGEHPPLDNNLNQYLRNAIAQKQTTDTPRSGAGGTAFRDVPEDGALLVGLAIHWKDEERTAAVGITPIYQTSDGQKDGPTFGQQGVKRVVNLARPGYALGSVELPNNTVIEGMHFAMMRVHGQRLDPKDDHGFLVRGRDPNIDRPLKYNMDGGSLVVGITGTTGAGGQLSGFGLVLTR